MTKDTSDVVARPDDAATDYVRRYVSLMAVGIAFRAASILSAGGDRFPKKEIYNALTYMTRAGQLTRLGYGRYEVAQQVTDWQSRALTAERLLAEARAALKPFADYADGVAGRRDDQLEIGWMGRSSETGEYVDISVTAKHFRDAAKARASIGGGNG